MTSYSPDIPTPKQFAVIDQLEVDFETGTIYKDGKPFGSKRSDGRSIAHIYTGEGRYKSFMGYHIIWYKYYGKWPTMGIDHDDRDCTNDAIKNLKERSQSHNLFNSNSGPKKSTNLPKGIHLKKNGRYRAYIYVKSVEKHLGYFNKLEDAIKARQAAELQYYGELSRV